MLGENGDYVAGAQKPRPDTYATGWGDASEQGAKRLEQLAGEWEQAGLAAVGRSLRRLARAFRDLPEGRGRPPRTVE